MQFERYAIYWAPPRGSALAQFGQSWLGSDPETGTLVTARQRHGLDADLVGRAVASPRRYGLHATLKAPMRLKDGMSAEGLAAALRGFAARRRRFRAGPLRLNRFERYLALVAQPPLAELDWLAQECETAFDGFRAGLDGAEIARRTSPGMSARQREFTGTFGYPHVLSEYIFHVTLAGPLGPEEQARVEQALEPALAPFCAAPLAIDEIVLLGDPGRGAPFRMIHRFPLSE